MLSRTASNLYWLSRNMERAECLARILDATSRLTSLPQAEGETTNEWNSAIATAACMQSFKVNYEEANEQSVIEFLAFSPYNPASIRNCLETARQNARAVRTALTVEMWDAINGAWHELKKFNGNRLSHDDFTRFLSFVKQASLAYDGSAYRTMLRNDAYWFSRLGILIERADATARILDVKYHVLLPEKERVGGPLDYFQWASILRSVSALTSYYWVYQESVKPWLVADLLILNRQMPRSLAMTPISCRHRPVQCRSRLRVRAGRRRGETNARPEGPPPAWRKILNIPKYGLEPACTPSRSGGSARSPAWPRKWASA